MPVLLHGQAGHDRIRYDPRRQDDGFRLDRFFRQVNLARLNGPHQGVGPDVRPAPLAEHPGAVIRQIRVDFRHDAVGALEQKETDLFAVHVFVKGRDPVHEGGQLPEQLYPDQPAANDREREQSAFAPGVDFHVGPLETLDDVVAEQEGVGEGFECECVLRTGDQGTVGHGPEGQDQVVVGQFGAFPAALLPRDEGEG